MFNNLLTIFVAWPWLAAIPAVFFYWLNSKYHLRITFYASLLWVVYLFWELGIWFRFLYGEDSNIRVDLLLIYPLLTIVSVVAIGWVLWSLYRK